MDPERWNWEAVTGGAREPGICLQAPRVRPLCFSSFGPKPTSSRQPSLLNSLIHRKHLVRSIFFPWQMGVFGAITTVNVPLVAKTLYDRLEGPLLAHDHR